MDGDRFDRLTRGLLAGAPRRGVVAGLLGGAAAALAGAGLLDAKKGGKGKGKGKGKRKGKNDGKKRTVCHCPNGNPNNCTTIQVGKKAAQNHLRQHCDYAGACRDDVVNPCEPGSECLAVVDTEGDVTRENGGFTAHAEGAVFGNLIFGVPAGTTFGDLESLASEFDFSEGQCGVGSPRFVVFLENGRCPYAQFPPEECGEPDSEGNTGNLIGNETPFVWNDDLCGGDAANNTYAEVLAAYEDEVIDQIVLVTDSSSGTATVTLDPCITLA